MNPNPEHLEGSSRDLRDMDDLLTRYVSMIRPTVPDRYADRVVDALGPAQASRSWRARVVSLGMRSIAPAAAAVTIALAGGAATVVLVADVGQPWTLAVPPSTSTPGADPTATPTADPRDAPVLGPAPSQGVGPEATDDPPRSAAPATVDPVAPDDDDGGAGRTADPTDEPDDDIDDDAEQPDDDIDDDLDEDVDRSADPTREPDDDHDDDEGAVPTDEPTDDAEDAQDGDADDA